MIKGLKFLGAILALAVFPYAQAIMVDAKLHSYNGGLGTGLDTGILLTTGQSFETSVALEDVWSAGASLRWSNADGLDGDTFSTVGDGSGAAAGVQIGEVYPLYTSVGGTFHYGSLVAQIGTGAFFKLGTSFSGTANANGNLKLFYWDSNFSDNIEAIDVSIKTGNTSVPDQGGLILSVLGFGMLALFSRLKKRS